ncbi:MAG: homoserine dehydrogenase [Oscillospiraceae bacterium]|nr:homoserine dehydrogenase [Oscillospiraceae bacterium]
MNVAILGMGTVGSGVADILVNNANHIRSRTGLSLDLKYIVDVLDFPDSPHRHLLTKDFAQVENDPSVELVAETIGGTKVAYEFTRRALAAGKSVVTSNKELVATHGYELMQLAAANGAAYLFEASVGGGIPVLRPMRQCLAANRIQEVCGILNGTTNYILTQMIQTGQSVEAALLQAQKNGYAELDPTADMEGHDACRKTCILASLAFGHHVYPASVPTEGITRITRGDADYAAAAGRKIKLLGRTLVGEDGRVRAYVAPHLVANSSALANVEDVFNAVLVRGDAVGEVMFYGPGAGKLPTASAVVADLLDAARHWNIQAGPAWEDEAPSLLASPEDLKSGWYVRIRGTVDQARALGAEDILGRAGAPADEVAFLLPSMSRTELNEALGDLEPEAAFRLFD